MNLFNIWESLNRETPFIARRTTWGNTLVVVDKVEPNGKGYGVAYGRIYHKQSNRFDNYSKIANSGTYSWVFVGDKDKVSSISIY